MLPVQALREAEAFSAQAEQESRVRQTELGHARERVRHLEQDVRSIRSSQGEQTRLDCRANRRPFVHVSNSLCKRSSAVLASLRNIACRSEGIDEGKLTFCRNHTPELVSSVLHASVLFSIRWIHVDEFFTVRER